MPSMRSFIVLVLWGTAALADPNRYADESGHEVDLRQFNNGFDPSFSGGTKSNPKKFVKSSGSASSLCTNDPPPAPLNSDQRCSTTSSGCVVKCLRNYKFPNGKAQMMQTCVDNEWRVQGENWETLPACQPVCLPECQNSGICVAPNQCMCTKQFSGPQCQYEEKPCLARPILPKNSHMKCNPGGCSIECMEGHRFPGGLKKANIICQEGSWVPRETEWPTVPDCEPICDPECQNGGTCLSVNVCQCPKSFRGNQCQYNIDRCSFQTLGFNGAVKCRGDMESLSCNISCPAGVPISQTPAATYTCTYESGRFTPQPVPQCLFGPNTIYKKKISAVRKTELASVTEGASTFSSHGSCVFWAASHLKSFDGVTSSFNSNCAYTLLKDTKGTLTVNIEKDTRRCISGSVCSLKLRIYIEDTAFTLAINEIGKAVLTQNSNQSMLIPVKLADLSAYHVGHLIVISLPSFGATLKWDSRLFLQVDVSEHLWSRTAGLCGTLDGVSNNDMECRDGKSVDSLPVFFSSWEAEFLGRHCDAAASLEHPCTGSALATAASEFCSKLLHDVNFQKCHEVLDQDQFYEACRWDFCASKFTEVSGTAVSKNSHKAACETVAIFVNECKRKGIQFEAYWRTDKFCGMNCTGGSVYKACGPSSEETCLSAPDAHQPAEFCVEGCYCPEGTVRHNNSCIQKEQCPCQYRGKLFRNGKSINQKCNTCVCQGGQWSCSKAICGARCSIVGDPHYTTFDGKTFDFMGKCNYYLVKTDDLSVEAENIECSGSISEAMGFKSTRSPSCTKMLTIRHKGSVIQLKQHRELIVNDREISRLPVKVADVMIRRLSSLFIAVEFQSGVLIWWDGISQAYIDVPASLKDKTKGLCGTFNNNQKDDFLTPEGDIEQDVVAFANKWKVQETCPNAHPSAAESPCDAIPEKKAEAERLCGKLKVGNFTECAWQVDVESYYKNCLFDMCSCETEPSSCFCPILASYAQECAANNVALNWRRDVRECGVQCPAGQTFQTCGDFCSHSCSDISLHDTCSQRCVEGCNCPQGQTLDKNGDCVPISQCPCLHQGREFDAGAKEFRNDANGSLQLCTCNMAHWQCAPASEGDLKNFPEYATPKVECNSLQNLEFTTCEPEEPQTCKNLHVRGKKAPTICKAGCICKKGYVLDTLSNTCVEPKKCPCHHGGRSYSDGATIQEKCNVCECLHGAWKCSSRVCSGTCSAWGDSHFKTFDGRHFDFQGQCSYALVQSHAEATDSFLVSVQSVICGSQGATCVRSVTISIGAENSTEIITLSKDRQLPPIGSLKRAIIRDLGLFVVVEVFDLGLVVRWDKGTRVYVNLDPKWKNRVRGLCGNFNDNEQDDFQTPSGGVVEVSGTIFGDSWRLQPQCMAAVDPKDNCASRPSRKAWAAEKCSVLHEIFHPCHSEVPVDEYYQRCLQDSCACDLGGDCECLCTAIAAYAQECNENGVPIKWRSQDLCPMQCDEKCSTYSPCISTCPRETCENFLQLKSSTQMCSQEVCVEGCLLDKCPEGQIYKAMSELKCIPIGTCKHPCMQVGNHTYYENDVMKQDACHTCRCSNHKETCLGKPCTTTVSTTTPTTTTEMTTTEVPEEAAQANCVPGWSNWISSNSPKKGSISSDREPLDQPQRSGFNCGREHVVDIKCRSVGTHIDFKDTNQEVTCDADRGLLCNGTAQKPCSDYEIQVKCECAPTTEETKVDIAPWCVTGWTDWFNNSHPDSDTGDYELISDIQEAGGKICDKNQVSKIQCKYIDPVAEASGVKSIKKRLKDFKESKQIMTCKKKQGLACNNLQQVDSLCYDYAMRVYCECEAETASTTITTPVTKPACPPGYEWRRCLYDCDALCHSFEATVRLEGYCSNKTDCKSGCAKIGEECDLSQNYRSENECVPTEDCTCVANDGTTIVQPGAVHFEDECTKCQCIDNHYKCVKVPCIPRGNSLLNTTTPQETPATTTEQYVERTTETEQCDFWSSWYNDHSPANDPFEREGKSTLELYNLGFCQSGHVTKIFCASTSQGVKSKKSPSLNTKCDLISGLVCYDDEQGLIGKCADYKVRYYCSCTALPTVESREEYSHMPSPSTTIMTTTVISPPHKCDPKKLIPLIEGEKPLGDAAITASSSMNQKYGPNKARIVKGKESDHTWLADEDDTEQYLQVDLGRQQPVYAISVRGNPLTVQFVTSYKVLFSIDGYTFAEATDLNGAPKVIRGPIDSFSVAQEILPVPFEARYVRVNPQTWQNGIAMQIEIFGCAKLQEESTEPPQNYESICDMEMGVGDGRLQDARISASSVLNGDIENHGPQLARPGGSTAWRPNHNSQSEWIMLDLTGEREVSGISIRGDPKANIWVTAYYLQYSHDGHQWNKILDENKNELALLGNIDATHEARTAFKKVKSMQYLKIIPIKWFGGIGMQIEVYGCFLPYPTEKIVEVPSTTPLPADCTLCPNLPEHKKEQCRECPEGLLWNGVDCVPKSDCACYVGHLDYPVGSVYELHDCQKCKCTLGGVPQCQLKTCPLCVNPNEQSVLTPTCNCLCKPCPEGSRMCPTSRVCILESQWCDGLEHCPDDEVNCIKSTLSPPVVTCPPELKCEENFVLKKTTKKRMGTDGKKTQLLRCPIYKCIPAPEDHFCVIESKTIVTFDNTTLNADICDHILAQEEGTWNVSATKQCKGGTGVCSTAVSVSQESYSLRIKSDLSVEFNGYEFDIQQAQAIAANYRDEFEIAKVGDRVIFQSNLYGFTFMIDDQGGIQIIVPNKLNGKVNGLCGLMNGDMHDDKTKPDGELALSSSEFVDSWKVPDSKIECTALSCPNEQYDVAYRLCMEINEKGKSLNKCNVVVPWDPFLSMCIPKVCECLRNKREQECKCNAALNYAKQCNAQKQQIVDISGWRVDLGCAIDCPPGEVHHDCYRRKCEPSCANVSNSCPVDKNTCFSGCFCSDGLVRKDGNCVKPEECKDCVCDGFGDPQYLTYDRVNYTFNGNCSYIASRDISSNGEHKFEIFVTNVECVDEPGTTCTEGVTILHQGHVISMRRVEGKKKIITTLDGEVIQKFPVKNGWMVMEAVPKSKVVLLLTDVQIQVAYLYNNHAFNIRLPSHLYADKTEGLCGNCNKNKTDDFKTEQGVLTGDIDEFGYSWLVKNLPKGVLLEENCKVNTLEECMPLPPDEDPCLWIMDEDKFGKCHQVVDPLSYIQACQFDVCHSKNKQRSACRDVEAYARECQRHGLCFDWRSDGLCPFECPADQPYQPCGPGCQKTCENVGEKCNFEDVEGCFCPDGQVLKGDKCVPEWKCKPCDAEGHFLGDVWNPDKCTTCTCENSTTKTGQDKTTGVKCTQQNCSPVMCSVGQIKQVVPGTENDCCPQESCIEKPKEVCLLQSPPDCGLNQELKNLALEFDCPEYVCQCVPKDKCPPVTSAKDFVFLEEGSTKTALEPGMQRVINESGCCPHETFVCDKDTCPKKECPTFHVLTVVPGTENKCCPVEQCVPPKDKCIFEPNFIATDFGGERNRSEAEKIPELHDANSNWFESPCRKCKCKVEGGIPTTQCNLKTCKTEENPGFEVRLDWTKGVCCPVHVKTACKVGDTIYKEGDKWSPIGDPCKTYICTKESGILQKLVNVAECNTTCDQGWKYIAPESDQCCGKCEQSACVVDGVLREIGESWTSLDKCTTFACSKSEDQIQVGVSTKLCPPAECPTDQLKISADGCCQVCDFIPSNRTNKVCSSETLSDEETVALVTEFNDVHGKCFNTEAIKGFKECIGSCESRTRYNRYDAFLQISDCKCCQGLEYEMLDVKVTCEDNHQYIKKLRVPTECSCTVCSSTEGAKKGPTKTKSPKFLGDIPAQ